MKCCSGRNVAVAGMEDHEETEGIKGLCFPRMNREDQVWAFPDFRLLRAFLKLTTRNCFFLLLLLFYFLFLFSSFFGFFSLAFRSQWAEDTGAPLLDPNLLFSFSYFDYSLLILTKSDPLTLYVFFFLVFFFFLTFPSFLLSLLSSATLLLLPFNSAGGVATVGWRFGRAATLGWRVGSLEVVDRLAAVWVVLTSAVGVPLGLRFWFD